MSLYLGNQLLAGVATNTILNAHDLFDFKWTDHELTDQSWLRADTFSWQDGTVYSDAYNHLVADNSGGTSASETIGSYTITYVVASDGHKITTDETTVSNIYSETGVAWYYVLDTANQRFKLPRTKFGFTGLRDTVGKFIDAGLPNIEGQHYEITSKTGEVKYSGAFYQSGTGTQTFRAHNSDSGQYPIINFDASRWSSIYGNSTTVQPKATQMYLYFYVGQFSQSATEQTAGLNASLFNGKADIDLSNAVSNASASAKETIVGWNSPDYTAGITVSTSSMPYTATSNGYVVCRWTAQSDRYLTINGQQVGRYILTSNLTFAGIIPWKVKKGDVISYDTNFVFYPCIGG